MLEMWKYQFLFLFIFGAIHDARFMEINILECNILFIQMESGLMDKLYIYDSTDKTKEMVYYFDEIRNNDVPYSSSALVNYITKELSNMTHIYFKYPPVTITYQIEIIIISKNGTISTINTSLIYNKNCFNTSYYFIEADIVDCSLLAITTHPASKKLDHVYIYEKHDPNSKDLIYYFNRSDIINKTKKNNHTYINDKLSNLTHILFFKPREDRFYKIELDVVSYGFLLSSDINLFYNNSTKCFETVSDYMNFHTEIKSKNVLSIIPDYKIRIIDLIYLYDMTNLKNRQLLYFFRSKNGIKNTTQSNKIIDSKSSNATYIKLLPSIHVFHKIEVNAISKGIVSKLQTEIFYEITTDHYAIISSDETKIYGVILDPIEPIVGQSLNVSVKYSLKHQHVLKWLLFQAVEDQYNIPKNICDLWNGSKESIGYLQCFNNNIWSQRVKAQFNEESQTIQFSQVLFIDNNFTFIWSMCSSNVEDDLDTVNVSYNFTIKAKDNTTPIHTTDNSNNLIRDWTVYPLLCLVIGLIILLIYLSKKKRWYQRNREHGVSLRVQEKETLMPTVDTFPFPEVNTNM